MLSLTTLPPNSHLLISAAVLAIAAIGVLAAIQARAKVLQARKMVRRARNLLSSSESWEAAYPYEEVKLREWMQSRGIPRGTGVSDVICVCWSAWVSTRAVTLNEIHALVARRERSKTSPRLSSGIATLLLVCGIVGTLFCIHPILQNFQLSLSLPAGDIAATDAPANVSVAENTSKVNQLMRDLSNAFYPSIAALAGTIVVVSFRGGYQLALQKYTLELDEFTMGTVIPRYAPPSITSEYASIRETFEGLAQSISSREEKFDAVVESLDKIVGGLQPALEGLDEGVGKLSTAADSLASRANSIGTTLTRTLGIKSPLYKAVTGFEDIFNRTNEELERMAEFVQQTGDNLSVNKKNTDKAIEQIHHSLEKQGSEMKTQVSEIKKIANKASRTTEGLPERLDEAIKPIQEKLEASSKATLKDSLDSLSTSANSSLVSVGKSLEASSEQHLQNQAKQAAVHQEELRKHTEARLDQAAAKLDKSSGNLDETITRLPKLVDDLGQLLEKHSKQNNSDHGGTKGGIGRIFGR